MRPAAMTAIRHFRLLKFLAPLHEARISNQAGSAGQTSYRIFGTEPKDFEEHRGSKESNRTLLVIELLYLFLTALSYYDVLKCRMNVI